MFNSHIRKMASEQLVSMDLLEKGYMVLKPLTDIIENYDLAVDNNGILLKVQVKSGRTDEVGRMLIDIRRSSVVKGSRHYEDSAYDVLAIANIETRQVIYIKKSDLTAKASMNVWWCEKDKIPYDNGKQNRFHYKDYMEFSI